MRLILNNTDVITDVIHYLFVISAEYTKESEHEHRMIIIIDDDSITKAQCMKLGKIIAEHTTK